MPPKKNKKSTTSAAAAADGTNNNNSTPAPAAGAQVAVKDGESPFLGKEMRVELTDGRVVVGVLISYQGGGDLLLRTAVEQRRLADGLVSLHAPHLLAIPFSHVRALQRRKPGHDPIDIPQEQQEEGGDGKKAAEAPAVAA